MGDGRRREVGWSERGGEVGIQLAKLLGQMIFHFSSWSRLITATSQNKNAGQEERRQCSRCVR